METWIKVVPRTIKRKFVLYWMNPLFFFWRFKNIFRRNLSFTKSCKSLDCQRNCLSILNYIFHIIIMINVWCFIIYQRCLFLVIIWLCLLKLFIKNGSIFLKIFSCFFSLVVYRFYRKILWNVFTRADFIW